MKSIQSILIANRGEIASRVIRTCKKLGIRSIAVFSEPDAAAPFVGEADVAVALGGKTSDESYLDVEKIILAAKATGAEAIHPGYGFLSENAPFARRCQEEEIVFVGPHPEAIEAMGSKAKAKELLADHEVPLIPGYNGGDQSLEKVSEVALEIGFPILLKASAGGGGKGMRIVLAEDQLEEAYASAKREARNAFGDDHLIVEKYFEEVRHVEFQIFGDQHGNVIHLLERECSIQRRYQKVLEESPSPALDEALRAKMGQAAVNVAKALNYDNAGTVEFILAPDNTFYFLEVNTRLQVEHPVTEMVTGLDLVEMQIESAEGRPLRCSQEEIKGNGYALEVRLYAEDPANDFLPVTGQLLSWNFPEMDGLRVESAVRAGSEISVYYDPMIAKLVVHGADRGQTFRKMATLLRNLDCLGVTTNREFLYDLVCDPQVQKGEYHTHFLDGFDLQKRELSEDDLRLALSTAALAGWQEREKGRTMLASIPSGWRNSDFQPQQETLRIGETEYTFQYRKQDDGFEVQIGEWKDQVRFSGGDSALLDISYSLRMGGGNSVIYAASIFRSLSEDSGAWVQNKVLHARKGNTNYLLINGRSVEVETLPRFPEKENKVEKGGLVTPMPCQVLKIIVEKGQNVEKGDAVAVLVSMKMENTLYSDIGGTVEEIYVQEGQNLEAGVLLMKLSGSEE